MPAQPIQLLDSQAVSEAEALGLHARLIVEGYLAGNHKSPFHGFSIEFTQHREYVPGDDLRHLDWKVLGRSDRYYIRQYEQETNFVCHLLVDGSESMKYASGRLTKLDYARQMAAVLAYVILQARDAVSLTLFDDDVRQYVPRTGNLASIHAIMHALASFQPTQATRIAPVLHQVAQVNARRGVVALISDCLDDEQAILDGIQHCRFVGHEVILFHVLDEAELTFPFKGNVEFVGLESSGRQTTRPNEIRKSYLDNLHRFLDALRQGCEKNKVHYVQVTTSHPLHETITGYLAFRQRTGGRK
jgi:uncharacterized protein (DUF58 family)